MKINILGNWTWYFLIVFLIVDYAVPFILGFFYPKYSHIRHVMSLLGAKGSPIQHWYSAWLIIWGFFFVFIAFKFLIFFYPVSTVLSVWFFIILIILGLGGVFSGIFPISQTRAIETVSEKVHGIASGLGFFAFVFFPLVTFFLYKKKGDMQITLLSMVCFILGIIFYVLFLMSRDLIDSAGLWQRLKILNSYILLFLIALKEVC